MGRARHPRQHAGMFLGKGIEEASLDEWHRLTAINLTGVFLGTKLASVAGLVGSTRSIR
jgi:NADP-dependent 3-hydroxy acid dehydrogenase YdfG